MAFMIVFLTIMTCIRQASEEELGGLAAIEISAGRKFADYWGIPYHDKCATLHLDKLRVAFHNQSLWVACDDTQAPFGFLAATIKDQGLHIEELSVHYDYQGQGAGRQLLSTALDSARDCGYPYVSLTTDRIIPWNRPFYERVGFRECALEDCYPLLKETLRDEKSRNPNPDNRIAMLFKF